MRPPQYLLALSLVAIMPCSSTAQEGLKHTIELQGGFVYSYLFGTRYIPKDTLHRFMTTPEDDHHSVENSYSGQAGVMYTVLNPFSTNQYFTIGIAWFNRTYWTSIDKDSLAFYNYNGLSNPPYRMKTRFHAIEFPILAGVRIGNFHGEAGIKLHPIVFQNTKRYLLDGHIHKAQNQVNMEGLGANPTLLIGYRIPVGKSAISPFFSAERRGYKPPPEYWDFSAGIRLQIWSK